MLGDELRGPAVSGPLWSRRVDVLIGFTAAMALWLVVAAIYLITNQDATRDGKSAADASDPAAFQTAAGGDTAMDPLDTRVNDFKIGEFTLGMTVIDVMSAMLSQAYVENSMWPTSLQALSEQAKADGSVNVFGADQQGVASYILEFCSGTLSRITERHGFRSVADLERGQRRDDNGALSDLPLKVEGEPPAAIVSRVYQHVYDSGRTARLNIRYEQDPSPSRVLTVSDTERCRREFVLR